MAVADAQVKMAAIDGVIERKIEHAIDRKLDHAMVSMWEEVSGQIQEVKN